MVTQEMLDKAIREYPIGTIVESAYNGDEYLVDRKPKFSGYDITAGPYIYYNEKWAKILSTPEPIINNTYDLW